jgi:gentisate 1,2-dioxygenase
MSGYQTRSSGERIPVRASLRGTDYPLGYQRVAINTVSASGLTPPAGTRVALIQAEGANIRYRDDGVAPTAAVGNRLLNAGTAQEHSGTLSAVQLIAEGAGAFLNISYYG